MKSSDHNSHLIRSSVHTPCEAFQKWSAYLNGISFTLSILCYVIIESVVVQSLPVLRIVAMIGAICIPVLFWLLARAIFDDHFKFAPVILVWFIVPTDVEITNVLLVHGSPRKINEYLFEDRQEKSLLRIMQDAKVHIMCFGHTHKPFHRTIKDDQDNLWHAINIGSVGKPKDGNPQGCYVILTMDNSYGHKTGEGLGVDFIRFSYDIEKAAKGVESSRLPKAYAEMLRKAY